MAISPRGPAALAGVLGLALQLACGSPEPGDATTPGEQRSAAPPNVLLIVLDTTRASAISAYGGEHAHTPHFDALAAEGVLFTNARATSSWTLPTHASLFTGLYTFQHNAHHETDRLVEERTTLAELLRPTHATASFSENPHIIRAKGFAQGFDVHEETWRPRDPSRHRRTVELFAEWFEARDRERPFFAFVNLFSTHLPYAPPAHWQRRYFSRKAIDSGLVDQMMAFGESQARLYMSGQIQVSPGTFRFLSRLYLATAAWTDERLGALLQPLRDEGVLDDTLVVVVSDHGESIGEHGLVEHQFGLYETVLRIPLAMRWSGRLAAGSVRAAPVQLVDVAPTVLEAVGLPPEAWRQVAGRSLLDSDPPTDRPVLAEYMRPVQQRPLFERLAPDFDFARFDRRLKSLQIGPLKLIASDAGDVELYDVASDPGELHDLAAERPDDVARLRARLLELAGDFGPGERVAPPELDEETRRQLRELGYTE